MSAKKPIKRLPRRSLRFETLEDRKLLAVTSLLGLPVWTEQGPSQIRDGQVVGLAAQNNPVAGAIEAIAAHPTNVDIVYIAAANGGIWKTTNATSASPNWTPLTDQYPSLAVTSIAFSPLDPTFNTLYAGTGRSSSGYQGGFAAGLLKTTDGGQTWTILGQDTFAHLRIRSVIPSINDPSTVLQTIIVSASDRDLSDGWDDGGIYRSTNGGVDWVKISGSLDAGDGLDNNANGSVDELGELALPLGSATELFADPGTSGRFYAAISGNFDLNGDGIDNDATHWADKGIYRSDNYGLSWINVTGNLSLPQDTDGLDNDGDGLIDAADPHEGLQISDRIELTVSKASGNPVYVAVMQNDQLAGVFRSPGGGGTWTAITGAPVIAQGDLHISMLGDSTDPDVLWFGGDVSATSPWVGELFRVTASTNTWISLTLAGANGTAPHADSRDMVFDASGRILEADDGGIYRLVAINNPALRKWESVDGNLRINEENSLGYDSRNNVIITGNQDTGTAAQLSGGNQTWDSVYLGITSGAGTGSPQNLYLQGDGNFSQAVDESNAGFTLRYSMGNNFGFFWRTSYNNSNVQQDLVPDATEAAGVDMVAARIKLATAATPNNILSGLNAADTAFTLTGTGTLTSNFDRIPFVLNAVDPTMLLMGYNGLYESSNGGDIIQEIDASAVARTLVTALAYGGVEPNTGTPDPNDTIPNKYVIYYARGNQIMVRTQANGAFTAANVPGAGVIFDIKIDPSDWHTAYAISSSHLYMTTNAGQSWQDITGALPINNLRSLEVVKVSGQTVVLVGGQGGVYRAINPSTANTHVWTEFGTGLPNVLATDMLYNTADNVLIVSTFGRGAWSISNATANLAVTPVLQITGDAAIDTVRLIRNQYNPSLLDVFVNNGSANPSQRVQLSTLSQIVFNGQGGNDTLTIDTTNGVIELPQGITFGGGTETDTLVVTGPAFTWYQNGPDGSGNGQTSALLNGDIQNVTYTGIETVTDQLPTVYDPFDMLRNGLENVADWSSLLNSDGLLAQYLPAIGDSLGGALNDQLSTPMPTGDAQNSEAGLAATLTEGDGGLGSQVLRRILEGVGGFSITDIGNSITTLDDLRNKLDGLDAIPDNVSYTQVGGVTRFDVEVKRTLDGKADLNLQAMDGAINVHGAVDISADVTMHLVFGTDDKGFFIDASGGAEPLLTVQNIAISGKVDGGGEFGFLEVDLKNATMTVDPSVKLSVQLHEPGPDPYTGATDGLIRLYELNTLSAGMATASLEGNPAADDVILTGTFEVSAVLPGDAPPFTLGNAQVTFKWADVTDPATVDVSASLGPGQDLMNFLQTTSSQIVSGLTALSTFTQQVASNDLLAEKLPFINKSLGDILGSTANQLTIAGNNVADVGDVYVDGTLKKFNVVLSGINLQSSDVAIGDTVTYKDTGNVDKQGAIASLDGGQMTISFDGTLTQTPNATTPNFRIQRTGSLQHHLQSILGDLSNPLTIQSKIPTLQSLVRKLAQQLGVNVDTIGLTTSGSGDSRVIEITPTFNLDPITFSQSLDLGAGIPGLEFTATGNFNFTITPAFRLPIGLRLGSGIDAFDRFYIKADATPEITLHVAAQLDDPNMEATIGFLNVRLQEDPAVTPNKGVIISADVGVNITDPGTNAADARVVLSELLAPNPLNVFHATIDGVFDIDGLKITADVGTSNVGSIQISLDGESGPAAAGHITTLSQLQNLPSNIQIAGEENFVNFDNITPEMILNMLSVFIDRLQALGKGGVMGQKIPVINKSLSDIMDIGQALSDKFGALGGMQGSQVATAKLLQNWLNSKLAPVTVQIIVNPGDIRFNFNYSKSYTTSLPISFDLQGLGSLVTLNSAGNVNVSADFTANLGLGINTTAGDISILDRVFLDASSPNEIVAHASVDAGYDLNDNGNTSDTGESGALNFSAGIINVPISARNVRALARVTLAGDIKDGGNSDNKLTLKEIADNVSAGTYGNIIGGNFSGDIQARIPLDGNNNGLVANTPGTLEPSDAIVLIAGRLQNLGNIQVDTATMPVHAGNAGGAGGANGIDDPLTSTELDTLGGTFAINTYNLSGLASSLLNFGDMWSGLDKLLVILQNALSNKVLQQNLPFVGTHLKDGVDFLVDIKNKLNGATANTFDTVQQALFNLLGPGAGGLNLLVLDPNHDGTPGYQYTDIVGVNNAPNGISFDLPMAGTLVSADLPIDFDIGIPGLGLKIKPPAAININVGWTFDLAFGLSKNDGFYFNTANPNELQLNVGVTIPGFDALGQLGFLQIEARDDTADPSHINMNFSVDAKDPIGSNNKFTLNELISGGFSLAQVLVGKATGAAHVNLDSIVSFGSADFPSLMANLILDWSFLNASTDSNTLDFGGAPSVAFKNVKLDVGSYFDKFVRPILVTMHDILAPIHPILDVFTARLPVLSDISPARSLLDTGNDALGPPDGKVSLLELAAKFGSVDTTFIQVVIFLDNLTQHIPNGTGQNIAIDLGDFNLGNTDPRSVSSLTDVLPNATRLVGDTLQQLNDLTGGFADQAYQFISDMAGVPGATAGPLLSFPLFEKPLTAVNLLFGRDVNLFLFDPPAFTFDAEADMFFPIIGPLGVELVGELHAFADFGFGMDTRGLREVITTGDYSKVFDGFYVSDRQNADGTGPDVPEVGLTGSIDAYGAIDIVIASAGVGGGLSATVDANLNDPNNDGKVYFDELIANFPDCIFDFSGEFKAGLSARLTVGVWPLKKTWKFDIASITLLDFNFSCDHPSAPPVLGTMIDSDTLRLNMGPNAGDRGSGYGSGNDDEKFQVSQKYDTNNVPIAGTVIVKWKQYTQEFSGVADIFADGGGGKDTIIIDQDLPVTATLYGGDGDDSISAGALAATIHGGAGNDSLTGGPQVDTIFGDDGDDTIIGGSGNDHLYGGVGIDVIQGQAGDDQIYGEAGNDSLSGGDGNDLIVGGANTEVGEDKDEIQGDAGNDTIYGGADSDVLEGGDGNRHHLW